MWGLHTTERLMPHRRPIVVMVSETESDHSRQTPLSSAMIISLRIIANSLTENSGRIQTVG
jgi:hypothetical protein